MARRIDTISEEAWQQAFHGVVALSAGINNAVDRGICTQLEPAQVIPQLLASRIAASNITNNNSGNNTSNLAAQVPVVNVEKAQ